ncbi:hypothetical protein RO3G_06285 [Rhizopus delemar RA 99-880]|uniref:Uncharacterized protein n=1 Tax=Rhizopus delemar (strain RA 99-880 / ATCC MYA-4621 / FGSC 9543 / NRRL 43880) TaxID=246409 RepID=I1BZF0_RHIO9|nr:hypothetical protein RO3G_06285 [Rhizopus delemar RA 99-880]|eukprot:EIE81580.1 hypothetical protein RO3G_06285 [Rhizopus delemar RA 99-880]
MSGSCKYMSKRRSKARIYTFAVITRINLTKQKSSLLACVYNIYGGSERESPKALNAATGKMDQSNNNPTVTLLAVSQQHTRID